MTTLGRWSTDLCDCCGDCSSCCLTCWCPCISFGQIAVVVDKGSTSCCGACFLYSLLCAFTGCQCIYTCAYRSKLRHQYMLPEQPCSDCCLHWCCHLCALCQEYRELKNRGNDPAIGWQGSLPNQSQGVTMAPVQVVMAPVGPGEMKR